MISIPLLNGGIAIVDASDARRVQQAGPWRRLSARGYTYASLSRRGDVLLHRVLMDAPGGLDVDHVNGDGLDNRRSNLRLATRAQNLANSGPRSGTSRYKGVGFDKRKSRWAARIMISGKGHFLGYHSTEEIAAKVYDEVARRTWGEFAYQNFPEVTA